MVQILPGLHEQLGPVIQQLGDTVAGLIDPNYAMKKQLGTAIRADPELAEKFALFAVRNPGMLEEMGLKNVAKLVNKVNPSPSSLLKDKVTNAGISALEDPVTAKVAGSQAAGAGNPYDNEVKRLEAEQEGKGYKWLGQQSPRVQQQYWEHRLGVNLLKARQEDVELSNFEEVDTYVKQNPGKSSRAMYNAWKNGSISGREMSALLIDPRTGPALQAEIREENIRLQKELANDSSSERREEARDFRRMTLAIGQRDDVGKVGSIEAHRLILFGDGDYAKMGINPTQLLWQQKQGKTDFTPEERDVLETAKAVKTFGTATLSKRQIEVGRGISAVYQRVKNAKGDPGVLRAAAEELNELYGIKSMYGAKKFTAVYDEGGIKQGFMGLGTPSKPRIKIIDEGGTEVTEEQTIAPNFTDDYPGVIPTATDTGNVDLRTPEEIARDLTAQGDSITSAKMKKIAKNIGDQFLKAGYTDEQVRDAVATNPKTSEENWLVGVAIENYVKANRKSERKK